MIASFSWHHRFCAADGKIDGTMCQIGSMWMSGSLAVGAELWAELPTESPTELRTVGLVGCLSAPPQVWEMKVN